MINCTPKLGGQFELESGGQFAPKLVVNLHWNRMVNLTGFSRNGIALIFARTETKCFFEHIWNNADAILFVKGRIRFYHISGIQAGTPGAPSVFIAYGKENALALKNSGIIGRYLELKS